MKETLIKLGIAIDNEYLDKYCELIKNNLNTPKEKFKTQAHHIIPAYTKKSDNKTVNLSHRDHFLAHYYLCLCAANDYHKFSNENALIHAFGDKYKNISQKDLENYNKILIDRNRRMSMKFKGKKRSPETIAKMSASLTGKHYKRKPLTEEQKRHLSEVNKGKPSYERTPEHRKLMSEKFKGHKVSKETRIKISNTLKLRYAQQ